MKMFVINRESLLRLGKFIGIYLVGLSVGTFVGLLPLLALAAGLPIVLAERQLGRRAAQIVGLVSLGATWILLDEMSFVYVGLGLMVGYSLATVNPKVPFRFGFLQTAVTGFVWAFVMNFVLKTMRDDGLLSLITSQFQQALVVTVERMQSLELYSPTQITEFQQYGQLMLDTLRNEWAYLLFVYLLISASVTYALSRLFSPVKQPAEDLLAGKAPLALAVTTALLAGLHYLMPATATGVVSNLWSIAALVMSLYGFALLFYYLRFLKVGLFWRILLGFYLFTSPIAWRVLLLVGSFDAAFDYRFYARKRQQG